MTILISSLIAVLGAVAVVHALWGAGVWFPLRNEEKLVRAVVGATDATRMPGPIPCGVVSGALVAVIIALTAPESFPRDILLGVAAAALILRGLLAWLPLWRRMTSREPFATLDQFAYGPLCLITGSGIAFVVLG